jgi:hypothetical protein
MLPEIVVLKGLPIIQSFNWQSIILPARFSLKIDRNKRRMGLQVGSNQPVNPNESPESVAMTKNVIFENFLVKIWLRPHYSEVFLYT